MRRVYEGWARGDFSEGEAFDPEIEFEMVDWPHPARSRGVEEMRAHLAGDAQRVGRLPRRAGRLRRLRGQRAGAQQHPRPRQGQRGRGERADGDRLDARGREGRAARALLGHRPGAGSRRGAASRAPSGASTTSARRAPARARPARAAAVGRGRCGARRRSGAPARGRARASSQLDRGGLDVGVVHGRPGQAQLRRPLAVDALAEQRHRGGGLPRAGAAEQGAVAAARVQADRDEAGDDLGVARDDATSVASIRLRPAPTAPPRTAATVGASSSPTRANER